MKNRKLILTSLLGLTLTLGCQQAQAPSASSTPTAPATAAPAATATPAAAATQAPAAEMLMGGAEIEMVTVSDNFDTVNNPRFTANGYIGSIEKDKWQPLGAGNADTPISYARGYSKRSESEFEASTVTIKFKDGREVVVNLPAHKIDTEGKWSAGDLELADGKIYIGANGSTFADSEGRIPIPAGEPAPKESATPEA